MTMINHCFSIESSYILSGYKCLLQKHPFCLGSQHECYKEAIYYSFGVCSITAFVPKSIIQITLNLLLLIFFHSNILVHYGISMIELLTVNTGFFVRKPVICSVVSQALYHASTLITRKTIT